MGTWDSGRNLNPHMGGLGQGQTVVVTGNERVVTVLSSPVNIEASFPTDAVPVLKDRYKTCTDHQEKLINLWN